MTRILTLAPAARSYGYAVLDRWGLVDAGVQSLRRPVEDRLRVLERLAPPLIGRAQASRMVVVTTSDTTPDHEYAIQVQERLLALCHQARLRPSTVSLESVKAAVAGSAAATRRSLMRAVIRQLPPLRTYRYRPFTWQERYYQPLFLAAAGALLYRRSANRLCTTRYAA